MKTSSLQTVDDGSPLQTLDVLFGLVEARLLLPLGRRAFHQLHKVVAINSVHDAEHAPAVVTDSLQVHPFTRVRLSCRRGDGREINRVKDKIHKNSSNSDLMFICNNVHQ